MVEQKDNLECQVIQVEAGDRIAVITGKYKDFIGYLKIATVKGKTQEFGYENGKNAAQPLIFDLEANENPTLVFGGLDSIGKSSVQCICANFIVIIDEKNSALAYLGFQIGKEDGKSESKVQA